MITRTNTATCSIRPSVTSPRISASVAPMVADGWVWNIQGVRRVPYRLPVLLEAIAADEPIYVVEGEKDADALVRPRYDCDVLAARCWKVARRICRVLPWCRIGHRRGGR